MMRSLTSGMLGVPSTVKKTWGALLAETVRCWPVAVACARWPLRVHASALECPLLTAD